ncbi:epidermal growth factor receptor substrate 15-like 1 [Benincasa hispida]|uniref:epidermal growth factor receptor substrate 15-like 1 n=1 Tax=Benincasa hispida TaxID=102211 RepID=UPI0019017E8D|nr:epidermal growth factor receptor substrate 15-like 1 [Benincasa hispida]XP_038887523.1 epidermal growth factor receptor substrate 15-like 1 [Benincasa hispida]
MASVQNPAPNVDLFDAYFRRADLDRDGRISGAEAVAFFQGSGLPKQVLAQIWALSDPRQIGFLGRAEFYNALRLVTVAQSKRELTPDIVKAALFSPAAAKIPAPQINFNTQPASQFNSTAAAPTPQSGIVAQTPSQSSGLDSQVPRNVTTNVPPVSSRESQSVRPPSATSNSALRSAQGFPGVGTVSGPPPTNSSISNDWVSERTSGVQGTPSQPPNRGVSPAGTQVGFGQSSAGLTASLPPRPQSAPGVTLAAPSPVESKVQGISGNGTAPGSYFGRDAFAATPIPSKQDVTADNKTSPLAAVPVSTVTQPIVRASSLDSLQSSFMKPPLANQAQRNQALGKPNQQGILQSASSGLPTGSQNSVSGQSQRPWPRMTQNDVQKYTKVFVEVDKDRDGKITGLEARNLFLSWRLPREVLKQVWDLSDQDNDSMLSVREFCIALYLLERHREGHILPAMLPSNIMFDFSSNGHPVTPAASNYSNAAWRPTAGYQQHQGVPGSGNLQGARTVGVRPPIPATASSVEGEPQTSQPKSKVPVLEKNLVSQLSTEEQNSLNSKFQEAADAEKKVEELEKEILESRQKIEYYRTKMQELVLYKSRCDNRLNEISERVSSDKREVESLAKKYEEKYKQSGDVASRLTVEEATFRDIQEKKMELYQAIVKMEQDGGADGVLQARADRIQSDIEELVKSLNERCKTYGLWAKPITLNELPFGWQPGIQVGAADWDEDWDKFEDEGFSVVKELTLDVQNVIAPPKQKSKSFQKGKLDSQNVTPAADDDTKEGDSAPNADTKREKHASMDETAVENGSAHDNKSEDGSAKSAPNSPFTAKSAPNSPFAPKSAPSSPFASSVIGSPKEYMDSNFGKAAGFDASPRDKDTLSDHGGAGSVFSGDKSYDEPAWGTFDTNDDMDSVWGFNAGGSTKTDSDVNRDNYFFDSGDLGLNPIRTDPFQAKRSTFAFDESVPSTPIFNSGNSPHNYHEGSEPSFDSFSRFDTSSVHDSGFFPPRDAFSRFDSMRSSRDFDQGPGFSSFGQFDTTHSSRDFDQSGPSSLTQFDSMRSSKDFDQGFPSLSRFDSTRSSRDFDQGFPSFSRFDSMRSSKDFDQGHGFPSFDDPDPFGSTGPFRASLDNQTPKKGSDNWSAF